MAVLNVDALTEEKDEYENEFYEELEDAYNKLGAYKILEW